MNKLSFLYGLGAGILITATIFFAVLLINDGAAVGTNTPDETQNLEINGSEENSSIESSPDTEEGELNVQEDNTVDETDSTNEEKLNSEGSVKEETNVED